MARAHEATLDRLLFILLLTNAIAVCLAIGLWGDYVTVFSAYRFVLSALLFVLLPPLALCAVRSQFRVSPFAVPENALYSVDLSEAGRRIVRLLWLAGLPLAMVAISIPLVAFLTVAVRGGSASIDAIELPLAVAGFAATILLLAAIVLAHAPIPYVRRLMDIPLDTAAAKRH
jgi:hypothetical protein